jgi:glycosyltransferase involved in cell wall biosynthesis
METTPERQPRVVLLSRDPSVADAGSYAAERLSAYAERVGHLHVIVFARRPSKLMRFHGNFTVDIIDTSNRPVALLRLFWRAARAVKGHDATLIVAQDPFETGIAAAMTGKRRGIPYVIEDHGAFFASQEWRDGSFLNRLRWAAGRHIARGAAGIRAVSQRAARAYRAMGVTAPIIIAPVAMRLAAPPALAVAPASSRPFTVLYAGRFEPEKDFRTLLEAFRRLRTVHPEARLRLVGDGSEKERIRVMAAERVLGEAVTIEPWKASLDDVYESADAALLASRHEGWSRFAVEAMSHGLPVVMTDVGIAGELLRDGTEGFVAPVGDAERLAAALTRLAGDPFLRMAMGVAGRRAAATVPTQQDIAERVTGFWASVQRRGSDAASTGAVTILTGIFPPDIGGPAVSVSMLAEAWTKAGHAVEVVTYSDPPSPSGLRGAGVDCPYKVRRVSRSLPVRRRYARFLAEAWRAASAPGPIFAQDGVASGLPGLIVAALRRRRFVVKVVGDFAWEHAQVQHGYQGSIDEFQAARGLPTRIRLLRFLQRAVVRSADAVIVPSRYLGNLVERWGVPAARLRVIYNGVPPIRLEEKVEIRPHRIVAAGRLVPWKHFDVLIKAMSTVTQRVPDATLMIVGDGPEEGRLRALAAAPHLRGKVHFVGRLKPEEVCRAMSASGAHALVSSYEGFSHQLVSAFQCGAPTVASRAGGNVELIEDGRDGLLVEVGDVDGTARALTRLLEDRELAARCVEAGRARAGEFSVERQVRETSAALFGRTRIVVVSRDPMAADPASYVAERIAMYAGRVEKLHVVALAKREAMPPTPVRNYTIEVIDARTGPLAVFRLLRRLLRVVPELGAALITTQDPFESGIAGAVAGRLLRVPCVIEDHGAFYVSRIWPRESALNAFRWVFGLLALRLASGLRVESRYQLNRYRAMGIRKPAVVAPLAMKLAGKPFPFRPGPPTFVYAGRFFYEKNVIMLVRAFAKVREAVPGVKLILAGTGPEAGALQREIDARGLGKDAEIRSWVHDPDDIYRDADVGVTPTDRECWPRFPLEAMSYGLPMIMTDVGMAGEVIRNGIEGFVIDIGDEAALTGAMLAVAKDEGLRRRFREAGFRRLEIIPANEELVDRVTTFWRRLTGADLAS